MKIYILYGDDDIQVLKIPNQYILELGAINQTEPIELLLPLNSIHSDGQTKVRYCYIFSHTNRTSNRDKSTTGNRWNRTKFLSTMQRYYF